MKLAPLAPLFERPGPWATVYLDTSAADKAIKDRGSMQTREIVARLTRLGVDEPTRRAVHDAVEAYPRGKHGGGGPEGSAVAGHAVFATHGEVVLDPPLTVRPPSETLVDWGPLPHVGPLLELAPDDPVCLIVYVDRTGADFELRTATGARPGGQVEGEDWPVHRTASSDWGERHFQLRVEQTWEQNARLVADAVRSRQEEAGADLIVLVGDRRERHSVRDHLPSALRDSVVETAHGGRAPGTHTRLLDADVAAARHAYVRDRTADELRQFDEARGGAGGRHEAAEGVPALVEAAREHRIATLFLRPDSADARREVWAGSGPDQLAVRRTETQYLGEPEPFRVRADDALLRSAALSGADAVVLADPEEAPDEAAEPVGGLGALLRWPYQEGEQAAEASARRS